MAKGRNEITRRNFLRAGVAGATAAGLPSWFTAEAEAATPAQRRFGPNDVINLGLIGCGDRGVSIALWHHGKPGVQIVAVTDPDDERATRNAAPRFGAQCKKHKDYKELLADKNVDAVLIGTPDHWHAKASIAAMLAGKDVYCEKPMTLTIDEGADVAKTARDRKQIFQTGTQQRSDPNFRLAVDLVRNGRIGKVRKVETRLPTGTTGGDFLSKPVPAFLDWNLWLGPAPEAEYCVERCHYTFRWWHEYSGGRLTDWGAHHNDIVQWALEMDESGPISVQGKGKNQEKVGPNCYSAFPEFSVDYEYANGVTLNCSSQGENGVLFTGEEGWIFVTRGKIDASDKAIIESPLPADARRVTVSNDHADNFLECVRTRKPTICTADVGHRSATVCHMANISLRLGGRKLHWDPKRQEFKDDPEANTMLKREWRET